MIQSIKSFTMMLPPHFNMFEYSEETGGDCDQTGVSSLSQLMTKYPDRE